MASPSDPKPMHELVAECRLLTGPYARTSEMRDPTDGMPWVFIQAMHSEPEEMDILRREFGWVQVTSGWAGGLDLERGAVYAHRATFIVV